MVLAGVVLLALAGCLRRPVEETLTLTWWLPFAADSAEYPTFQGIAEDYTLETGQEVELVPVPWSDIAPRGGGASRLAIAQESGTGPDIWGPVPHSWTGSFAVDGQALVLEATQVQDAGQYIPLAMQACQFDGKQYALPVLMDSIALIYNRELVPNPPRTFEELIDLTSDLTDGESDRWGLALPLLSQYHVYPFMDAYGGYIMKCDDGSCDPGDIGLNSEGGVRGIQFLSDLYLEEKLFPEALADRAVMHSHALRLFVEGRAGMLIDGPWVLPEIRASGIDYGVAALPSLPEAAHDPRPLINVQIVAASAATEHPEEALALLNHVASEESVLAMYDVLNKIPVRRDALRSSALREDSEARTWRDRVTAGILTPNLPELGYVWGPWGKALDEAIPGLTPAQDVLDRAVEQILSDVAED